MKFINTICVVCIMIFFNACVSSVTPTPLVYKKDYIITDKHTGEELDFNDFIESLQHYDVILLGEKHDVMKHHQAQVLIIEALAKKQPLDVVFEMFPSASQTYIDAAKSKKESIQKSKLKNALNWESKWDYKMYRDIIELGFYADSIYLIGGNISSDEINIIYAGAEPLKGKYSTTNQAQEKIAQKIIQAHNIVADQLDGNRAMIDKLVQIQQYKDRRMADKLVHAKHQSVLIAGKHHTNKTMGVPLHIKDFKSSKKVAVVFLGDENESLDECDYMWHFF